MRSSTSNSDARLPGDPGGRTIVLAFALFLIALIAWEATWRRTGIEPSPGHGDEMWWVRRASLPKDAVALIGTSRVESGIDVDALSLQLGRDVVQLALPGSSPLPLLEDLADDPAFEGDVVMGFVSNSIFDASGFRESVSHGMLASVDVGRRPSTRAEVELRMAMRGMMVSFRPQLSALALMTTIGGGQWPSAPYVTTRASGFRPLDFERVEAGEVEASLLERILARDEPMDEGERDAMIVRIGQLSERVLAKGGQVVFVRLPSAGRIGAWEDEAYPRSEYWDTTGERLDVPMIHYADVPELAELDCPDGSHLDVRDTVLFTRVLGEMLAPILGSH